MTNPGISGFGLGLRPAHYPAILDGAGPSESGVDWSIVSAATLLAVAPLLIAFLLFQRQFVQSFMYAGIK